VSQQPSGNGAAGATKELSALQKAYLKLEEMQARLAASERSRREPIAIVGMACRLPGGVLNPDQYWQLLEEGRDAVTEAPPERWSLDEYYDPDPRAPGKMCTRWGGFLSDVDQFDAAFFGITPREAINLDPQQRLLLEVAWEALESAGIPPDGLAGSRTGVFVGVGFNDYARLVAEQRVDQINAYSGSGVQLCFAAGRISYALGLNGPSFIVDTACSSSLVALHQACQSLRAGECDVALAGGVNLLLAPEGNIFLSQAGALSPTGRCKTFDAAADGMVRSDGCGVLVLKRLRDATADGDAVLAVIRGSAVNHDGRSSGLTVPSGPAQEAVMRAALQSAGLTADAVSHVEAHGTGTALGDPIEVHSTAAVYGKRSADVPALTLSSVKTNLGHSEAASGVASVIKAVQMLRHRRLAPHLHFKSWNPHVTLDGARIRVPTRSEQWGNVPGRARIAGVSSFGLSGTNAHVLIEEATQTSKPSEARPDDGPYVLPISAKKPAALATLLRSYTELLAADATPPISEICRAAAVGRSHQDHRAVVVATSKAEALEQLKAHAEGRLGAGVLAGRRPLDKTPGVVFVFCGSGSEWPRMGAALLECEPAFTRALGECDELIRGATGWSVLDELRAGPASSRLDLPEVAQPALFALQVALAALWRSWGIEPAAVVGCGAGEIAAAHVAGVLTLGDAVRLVCRSRPAASLPGFDPGPSSVPFISSVTGSVLDGRSLDGAYWAPNVSSPLRFDEAVQSALTSGHRVLLEVGPHPVLALPVVETSGLLGGATIVASLRRVESERATLRRALANLYVAGCDIDWRGVHPEKAPRVAIPTYPWQHQRFWVDRTDSALRSPRADLAKRDERSEGEDVRDWLYELSWVQRKPEGHHELPLGTWLLLADRGGVAARLAASMRAAGHTCVLVAADELLSGVCSETEDVSGRAFASLIERVSTATNADFRGVFHLWSLDATGPDHTTTLSLAGDQYLGARSAVQLIQALAKIRGRRPRVWFATRGVNAPIEGAARLAFAQAPLWGIGRTCSAEHPDLWGGLVDLDPIASVEQGAEQLLASVTAEDREDQVAYAGGERYVARLVRQKAAVNVPISVSADRNYVVTGGLEGLGLEVARWLVTKGARHLTLVGRTKLPGREQWPSLSEPTLKRRADAICEIEARGAIVEFPSVDISSKEGAEALSAHLRAGPPLGGIFHAASAWKDSEGKGLVNPLAMTTPASFDVVLPPKVAGSFLLQEICHAHGAEFLVFFSSGAALVGSAGQGNYAAANAFMDGLAHDVSRRGRVRCLSVNWGPIANAGFGATPEGQAVFELWRRRGIMSIDIAQMFEALERLLMGSSAQAGVMKTDWELLRSSYSEMLEAPWASELVDTKANPGRLNLGKLLEEAPARERYELLCGSIQEEVARVMGFTAAELPELDQGLFELGLDSLLALDLKNGLQSALRREVPVAALFEHSTIASLASYLLSDVLGLTTSDERDDNMPRTDIVEDIASLSESDVERLLAQRMAEGSV
jgi:phthiocerol/phenolphthiocerol synthesis type-I polyketide synthase B